MSRTATSVLVFGIYLIVLGAILMLLPNLLLLSFGFPATEEVWIRVLGVVTLILGIYYLTAARYELRAFFGASVGLRASVIFFFLVFVLFRAAEPQLLLFGAIDLAGAFWTLRAIRLDEAAAA